MITQLLAAIVFLTRAPIGGRGAFGPKEIARSARWFPLVGALLGGIYVAIAWIFTPLFPSLVTAALVAALGVWLTGALHLDGLADTADGFGSGRSREEVLRIMRDPAVGSYGAAAVALVIALKIVTAAALIDRHALPALLVAPTLGRWSAVVLSATQNYARPVEDDALKSVGSPSRFIGRNEMFIATIIAVAIAAIADRWRGGAACIVVALGNACWAWRCRRRIGGVTGDTLGAGVELSECLVLLTLAALH